MKDPNCHACAALKHPHRIRSRSVLKHVVKVLMGELRQGTLTEAPADVEGAERQTRFSALMSDRAPHGVVVNCYFRCTGCDALFCLSCVTHHGADGRWAMAMETPAQPRGPEDPGQRREEE